MRRPHKDEIVQVRLDHATKEALFARAARRNQFASELIRDLIHKALGRPHVRRNRTER